MTLVHSTTSAENLVIAGGGSGAKSFSGGEPGNQDFAGGGAGGSYSISNSRTFEQHDENPGLGQTGLAGDALVTWIEQSDLTLGPSGPAGSVELDWTTPGFSEDSERLGTISYKIYRDGTEIHTTSGNSFVGYPGSGVHVYQIESVAPLNNKAGTKVGDLEALSESQNSEEVPVVAPSITAVSPRAGPATGGTVITIEGTNLIGSSVTIGGVPCTSVVVNQTGTSLTCLTPAGSAGGKLIKVTNDGGSTNAGNFSYQGGGGKVLKPLMPTKVAVTGGPKSSCIPSDGRGLQLRWWRPSLSTEVPRAPLSIGQSCRLG